MPSGRTFEAMLCAALALAALAPAAGARPEPGSPYAALGRHSAISSVAVQPDGKPVVAGFSDRGRLTLARYDPDGGLDRTFGRSGIEASGFNYVPGTIAVRPGGGILVLGAGHSPCTGVYSCSERIPVFAFDSSGAPDPSFGDRGNGVAIAFAGTSGGGIALQGDGKILVAGTDRACHVGCFGGGAELARLDLDGSLDPGFGAGGMVSLGQSGGAFYSVAVGVDGSIYASGDLLGISGPDSQLVARFDPSGRPDPGFGSGGLALRPQSPGGGIFGSIVLPPGGGPIAGGVLGGPMLATHFGLDGSLDSGFGSGGATTVRVGVGQFGAGGGQLTLTPGGIVIAQGSIGLGCRQIDRFVSHCRSGFATVRLTDEGGLDPAFGRGGVVKTPVGRGRSEQEHYGYRAGVAVDAGGRIFVGGGAQFVDRRLRPANRFRNSFALAAYLPDGALDPDFGRGGLVQTPWFHPSRRRPR